MRILLVFPGLYHEDAFPLGLASLAAAARRAGHEVAGCDLGLEGRRALRRRLAEVRPDWVGIAVWAANARRAARAAAVVRAASRARLLVGGPHATLAPAEVLGETGAEVALRGEADVSLVRLLAAAPRDGEVRGLPGTAWLGPDGALGLGPDEPDPVDLDALPPPDRAVFPLARYPRGWTRAAPLRAPVVTSRGCPCRCAHCTAPALHGGRWRPRSPACVASEMAGLAREHGVRWVDVEDEHPLVDRARFLDLCERLERTAGAPAWGLPNGLRPETLDEPLVDAMARAGCRHLALGVESAAPGQLTALGRHPDLGPARAAARWCRARGIDVTAYFMVGLPGDAPGAGRAALREAAVLGVSRAHFCSWEPLPGARLAQGGAPPSRALPLRRAALYLAFYARPGRARRSLARAGATPGDVPGGFARLAGWLRGGVGWGG